MNIEQGVFTSTLPMLILGLGWTGQFLAELLVSMHLSYAATTRDGRNGTIAWSLPENCRELSVSLPYASTVLVTFPVMQAECMTALVDAYEKQHGGRRSQWILLSSTRPFVGNADRHSPLDRSKDTGRMGAEDVLLARGGTVLHLAGLWGAQRQPKNWVPRFPSSEAIKNKLLNRQLHLIHGEDVARAIVSLHQQFASGERWILTDQSCYDWIELFLTWGNPEQIKLARQLAKELEPQLGHGSLEDIVARRDLQPRLDSHEFWQTFNIHPSKFLQIKA
ncbi:hypothetical protein BY458DRAFT_517893 [Sporodiniella umbellata]|nr:hypothetical protein BY458DRAFT_517893 [Sporodiniella umbellata]